MKLAIIKNRKYFYIISATLFLASLLSLIAWGLKLGLDFTGGSLIDLNFSNNRPQNIEVQEAIAPLGFGDGVIRQAGDKNIIIHLKALTEDEHQSVLLAVQEKLQNPDNRITEERFESVGPVIGRELQKKALAAMAVASLAIIFYVAYAFRKVSKPIASWKYGLTAVIALIHDVIITVGLFSILGRFAGIEVDGLFITALLTIMGFSVHDSIVVFDRTRENLSKFYSGKFDEVANDSVNQTMTRSINTSITTLLVIGCLFLFGGASIKNFTLALLFGITIGTYSSIFLASPLIVDWNIWDKRLKKK